MRVRRGLVTAGLVTAVVAVSGGMAVASDVGGVTLVGKGAGVAGGAGVHKRADPGDKVNVADFGAVARELGISTQALIDGLDGTKRWLVASGTAEGTDPTAVFEQHLAAVLKLPVARVAAALEHAGIFGKPGHDVKKDGGVPGTKIVKEEKAGDPGGAAGKG